MIPLAIDTILISRLFHPDHIFFGLMEKETNKSGLSRTLKSSCRMWSINLTDPAVARPIRRKPVGGLARRIQAVVPALRKNIRQVSGEPRSVAGHSASSMRPVKRRALVLLSVVGFARLN